jgi:hypothetical protein
VDAGFLSNEAAMPEQTIKTPRSCMPR